MSFVIVDLEATCWEKVHTPARMETIEIGAVRMDTATLEIIDEFSVFVKPTSEPTLSDFCRTLTSIRQADVDAAPSFPDALARFVDWAGPPPVVLCSWGIFDRRQLERDCARHRLPFPTLFERHVNLKHVFAEQRGVKPCGMKKALEIMGAPLAGTHHRGIDDARNIARMAQQILRDFQEPVNQA